MAEPAKITDLNLETEFADSDMFPFSDVSSGLDKRISGADLRKNVSADIENVTALKLFEGTRDGQIVWLNGHGEEGDGGEGVVRWDASSTETANDGTIFQVTGVATGRWKRASKFFTLKDFGAVGDGVEDDSDAWGNFIDWIPDGGVGYIDQNSVFRIDTGKSYSEKSITLIFEDGATLLQGSNTIILEASGSYGENLSVTSIDEVTEGFPAAPDQRVTRLTVTGDMSGISVGDIMKIYSSDRIPRTRLLDDGRGQYMGHFMMVAKVDEVNDYIYFSNVLPFSYMYTTAVKAAKLNDHTITIKNPRIRVDANDFTSSAIILRNFLAPAVTGFVCKKAPHRPLVVSGCYGYTAEIKEVSNIDTEQGSRQGYAFFDVGSSGVCRINYASNLRHAYSNDASFINPSTETNPGGWGWSHDSVIYSGIIKGCTSAGLDTHSAAFNTHFIGGTVVDGFSGKESDTAASAGPNLQARGYRTKFSNVVSRGGRFNLYVDHGEDYNNDAIKEPVCILSNVDIDAIANGSAIRILGITGFSDRPTLVMEQTTITDIAQTIGVIINDSDGMIDFGTLRVNIEEGTRDDIKSIFSIRTGAEASNYVGSRLIVNSRDVDISTFRLCRIDCAWTGKLLFDDVKVFPHTQLSRIVAAQNESISGDFQIKRLYVDGNIGGAVSDNPERFSRYRVSYKADNQQSDYFSKTVSTNQDLSEIVGASDKNITFALVASETGVQIESLPVDKDEGQILNIFNNGSNDFQINSSSSFSGDTTVLSTGEMLTATYIMDRWRVPV